MANYKYVKPHAVPYNGDDKCSYGCDSLAKFKFGNGKLCCSEHFNSCKKKRKDFSDRIDHQKRHEKSLKTRIDRGITKSSQIKGGATRRNNGHYDMLAETMKKHWESNPWNNNTQCPLIPYDNTELVYQGNNEYKFLESLKEQYGIRWIVENVSRGPSLWYIDPNDNSRRLYISDFIIGGTIYEIKSGWTWNKHGADSSLEAKNKSKLDECIRQGYNVKLIIDEKEIIWH